jgi:hypothetical protein
MRTRQSTNVLVALFSAALATAFLIACQQSQPSAPSPMAEPKTAASEVYVIFEGPWAIVPDPKDPNSVVAIAPKTKSHRPLAVVPTSKILDAGTYELAIPAHGTPAARDLDKGFLRVPVDPKDVQKALDDKMERYAIRLPKPETYVAETRFESRVDSTYPPKPATQQNYVTAVTLVYHVTTRTGFSLTGTKDEGGTFAPQLPQLDTPIVRFVIDPAEYPEDACYTHSRQAFHDLVRLLGVTLYVDFPDNREDCRKKDPQLSAAKRAQMLHGFPGQWTRSIFADDMAAPQEAGMSGAFWGAYLYPATRVITRNLEAVFYFFHTTVCHAPVVIADGS